MSMLVLYSVKQLSFLPQSKQELSANEVKRATFIVWKRIPLWPWVHSSIISSTYNYWVWLGFTTQLSVPLSPSYCRHWLKGIQLWCQCIKHLVILSHCGTVIVVDYVLWSGADQLTLVACAHCGHNVQLAFCYKLQHTIKALHFHHINQDSLCGFLMENCFFPCLLLFSFPLFKLFPLLLKKL